MFNEPRDSEHFLDDWVKAAQYDATTSDDHFLAEINQRFQNQRLQHLDISQIQHHIDADALVGFPTICGRWVRDETDRVT